MDVELTEQGEKAAIEAMQNRQAYADELFDTIPQRKSSSLRDFWTACCIHGTFPSTRKNTNTAIRRNKHMDAINAIFTRRSTREFTEQPIESEKLHQILDAAMSGPCCVNARDWSFVVVTEKEKLWQMAAANGEPARPLKNAAAGILVCGDLERAFPPAKDYWIVDGAIAAENICLCAHALGIGSVWLGTWPQMDRVQRQRELFDLPDTVIPHSIIALGYPTEDITTPRESRYEEDRVHFNKW